MSIANSQIFKYMPTYDILINFLSKVSLHVNNTYIFDFNSYKKADYQNKNYINELLDEVRPYYYVSKQIKYIDREMNYNNLTTILRQLANILNINYTSQIKYDRSIYNIEYKFFWDPSPIKLENEDK